MKAGYLFLFFCAMAPLAFCQEPGGILTLKNFPNPVLIETESVEEVLIPVEGSYVQVLYQPIEASEPFMVIENGSGDTGFSFRMPGAFDGGVRNGLDVPPFSSVEWIVRAWRGAELWEEAIVNPESFIGETPPFENPVGYFDPSGTPIHVGQFNRFGSSPGNSKILQALTIRSLRA